MPARRATVATTGRVGGFGPAWSRAPWPTALVGLVEVADHRSAAVRHARRARRRRPPPAPDRAPRRSRNAGRRSARRARAARVRVRAPAAIGRPGSGRPAASTPPTAGRRAPVVGAQQSEERRADGQSRPGAGSGCAAEGFDVKCVVQHAGVAVDRGHASAPYEQRRVAVDLAVLRGRDAQRACGTPVGRRPAPAVRRPARARSGPSSGELSASRRSGGPSPPSRLVSDGGSSTITATTLTRQP